jgi:hypothetical protein
LPILFTIHISNWPFQFFNSSISQSFNLSCEISSSLHKFICSEFLLNFEVDRCLSELEVQNCAPSIATSFQGRFIQSQRKLQNFEQFSPRSLWSRRCSATIYSIFVPIYIGLISYFAKNALALRKHVNATIPVDVSFRTNCEMPNTQWIIQSIDDFWVIIRMFCWLLKYWFDNLKTRMIALETFYWLKG